MVENKDRWSALSMKERADLISTYVSGGVMDLAEMKRHYNSFGDGGRILDGKTENNQTTTNTPWWQQSINPLSPLGQAINDANTNFNYKYSNIPEEELKKQLAKKEAGLVSEYMDKEGKATFVPKGQAITPLEASVAEWLPGTGDVAEIGQITNDLDNSDYLSAAIGAGLLLLPGNVGKLWKKGKEALGLTKKASKATKVVRDPNLVTDVINTVDDDALMYLGNELPESAFKPKHNPLEDIKLQSKMDDFPAKVAEERDLYSKLQKLLKREDYEGFKNMFFEGNTKELKEFLISKGVDESILTQPALERLQAARMYDILQNSSNPTQFALRSKPIDNPDFYRYKTFYDNQRHGVIDIHLNKIVSDMSPEGPNVSMVKNISSPHIKGASESAYNAVIKDLGSVVTGKNLLAPKLTTTVTDKYLDKILLGNFGMHGTVGNQPVYRLLKPTYDIPIKYIDEFGLDAVDDLGYFNIDFTKDPTYAGGGKINRFDIGGDTTSTETNTQVVEEPTSSNPYKYSVLDIPYDRTTMLNRVKPFYVTDENGNFVKGADGKVIPSVLGNILNTQLQPLRDIKGTNYYAPGNPHVGSSNEGEQPASSDAEQFLLNWYNSPKTIDIIKKEAKTYKTNVFQDIPYTDENGNTMMYSPTPEETVALRSRLASEVPEYKDVPMEDNTIAFYRPKTSFTKAPSLSGEVFSAVQNRDGANMYIGPSIQYGNNESENSGSWVPLHEQNHAFQHQLLPSYFRDKNLEGVGLEHDELKSEQHSYLMALRAALGLNPEKRDYTKEDAQQMIDALQDYGSVGAGSPGKLLEVINNDAGKLAYMLNTWAFADNPEEVKKELTLRYSNGGKINRFEDGGNTDGGPTNNSNMNYNSHYLWNNGEEKPAEEILLTVPMYTAFDGYTEVKAPKQEVEKLYGFHENVMPTELMPSTEELQNKLNNEVIYSTKKDNWKDHIEDDDRNSLLNIIRSDSKAFRFHLHDLTDKYRNSDPDTSEMISINAPNTDISKFIFGNKISKNSIEEIKRVAKLRNQDPYDILSHMLIEGSGYPITTDAFYNTNDVIKRQVNPSLYESYDTDENILKQLGIYNEEKTPSVNTIKKAYEKIKQKRENYKNSIQIPESTIDAVALRMLLHGRDFNPAQKGTTDFWTREKVKNSYLDMIDSAIGSLKENMPDLFK